MWALLDDSRIAGIKHIITDSTNSIYYSVVSSWEVEIKHLKNKDFRLSGQQLCFLCDQNGLLNLSIQNKHVMELKDIINKEIKHNDPFDKMLLAQAISENMIFITHDHKFEGYDSKNLIII